MSNRPTVPSSRCRGDVPSDGRPGTPLETWQPLRPGNDRVHLRLLELNPARGSYVFLLRALPGVELPSRCVRGSSTIITLQGRWKYKECDWVAGPESFTVEATGRALTLQTLPECTDDILLLVMGQGDQQWLDAAGDVVDVENSASLERRFPGWVPR